MKQSNPHQTSSAKSESSSRWDKALSALSLAGLAVLIFLGGSIVTVSEIFPGPQIMRAYQAGMALYNQRTQYQDVYGGDIWYPERRSDKGVTVYRPGQAQDGLTLYVSASDPAVRLIDMNGNMVHEWRRPFSTFWKPSADGVARPRPDEFVYIRTAKLFPNGDLLAVYEGNGDTPYGYGVVKLDRNSRVIWSYFGRAHHDLDVAPDGKIYVLTHEFVDDELKGAGHLKPPRLDDFLVVLSSDGEELRKIPLLQSIAKSRYRQLLYTVSSFAVADPLHANAVDFIDRKKAKNFAFGKAGQVLLSFRELNAITVLDPETSEITWATRGPWIGQHDPDILPNGTILLFDNYGNYRGPEGGSRVIEFDPRTMAIRWQYAGTAKDPLNSLIRSDQQRLPNGNTLITESDGGRIVEVTPQGEIAWEFVNPVRGGPDGKMIPIIAWSQRVDLSGFDASFRQAWRRSGPSQMRAVE
ncbi:arylsulfotransferase family protein [Nitratireductor rhodophyticola]|uniref:arylsulfotransferase family protein n=1 Tax=Nitratireductor rhodophyticola TaxID=2854036 RepID=UPI00300AB036